MAKPPVIKSADRFLRGIAVVIVHHDDFEIWEALAQYAFHSVPDEKAPSLRWNDDAEKRTAHFLCLANESVPRMLAV